MTECLGQKANDLEAREHALDSENAATEAADTALPSATDGTETEVESKDGDEPTTVVPGEGEALAAEKEEEPTIESSAKQEEESEQSGGDEREAVVSEEEESTTESSKQVQEPGPSELELREKMIKDTVKQLIGDSNKYELRPEKPFDDDSAQCLLKAALKICHLKKFYDATNDKIVYFPSPVHACFDYSLMEAAEEFYEEEYPSDLCRALRNVAFGMIQKEGDDTYDEEYMALVATDVEI